MHGATSMASLIHDAGHFDCAGPLEMTRLVIWYATGSGICSSWKPIFLTWLKIHLDASSVKEA